MKKSKTKSLFMVLLMVLICNAQFMPTYDYIYTPYFTSRYSPRVWYYIPYADTNSMFSFQQPTFNIPSFVSTPSMSSSGISQQLSTSRSSEVQAILDRANGITPSSSITSGLTNFQSNSIPTPFKYPLKMPLNFYTNNYFNNKYTVNGHISQKNSLRLRQSKSIINPS